MITPYSNIISVTTLGANLLLDTYTGAAAAYSLRLLSTSYTGDAIEVRRASDNATQDIGFVNNELGVTSLESFCSGTNGFVTTWYDQSGNGRDATQGTDVNQPQIVSSGSVILENGKPAAQFDGSNDVMTASGFGTGSERSVFFTMRGNGNGTGYENYYIFLISPPSSTGDFMQNYSSNYQGQINANFKTDTLDINSSTAVDIQSLLTTIKTTSTSELFQNSTSLGTGSGTQTLEDELSIGNFSSNYAFFKMQEMVVYNSDESSNRTGIETNINDFYSIYYVATNSEYQDVLDYADSQGYQRPSYAQCALQDALVGDLKDAGVWSKLDTFYVFATDGDSDFAGINFIDPNNHEITEVNSPTFTSNVGFTGDNLSAYLDPSYNQGTDGVNWSNPNGSFGVWVDTPNTVNQDSYIGDVENLSGDYSTMRRGNRKIINGNSISIGLNLSNTFAHINVNSSQADLWYNGSNQASLSPSGFVNSTDMTFLSEGGAGAFADGTISIGFFGGDLSSEQSDFYTAVNSYMTSI